MGLRALVEEALRAPDIISALSEINRKRKDFHKYELVHIVTLAALWNRKYNYLLTDWLQNHSGTIHAIDSYGRTPLHCAIIKADSDNVIWVVDCLICAGANVNCRDIQNMMPIHYAMFPIELSSECDYSDAVTLGISLQLIRKLIENGADINCTTPVGLMSIVIGKTAASKHVGSILNYLIANGIKFNPLDLLINIFDSKGLTDADKLRLIDNLITCNQDIFMKTDSGFHLPAALFAYYLIRVMVKNPKLVVRIFTILAKHHMDFCVRVMNECPLVILILRDTGLYAADIITAIISAGAKINRYVLRDNVFHAAKIRNIDALALLMPYQRVDRIPGNISLLHAAADCANCGLVAFLSDKFDCNELNGYGQTALIVLSRSSGFINNTFVDTVITLIRNGTNPNIQDVYGKCAIEYIIDSTKYAGLDVNMDLIRLLLDFNPPIFDAKHGENIFKNLSHMMRMRNGTAAMLLFADAFYTKMAKG